ncbi:hypothetical protein LQ564_11530 [Massilia sp. G4R7]|uniref:Uncharacterized protein n=1 Tax=Massilia phyllostachyos TaxID=2898585 RepID=A0ABS8Q5A5_9BURK|nr:hypothetical protein [Massilia phyllostachyos]MCD2516938.1 hypothetical protein [Massilia phyllostachyos]
MSNFDHLPDDATRLTSATIRSHFTHMSRHPTMVGWLGRYALAVLLLGAVVVLGGQLAPVLHALFQ